MKQKKDTNRKQKYTEKKREGRHEDEKYVC